MTSDRKSITLTAFLLAAAVLCGCGGGSETTGSPPSKPPSGKQAQGPRVSPEPKVEPEPSAQVRPQGGKAPRRPGSADDSRERSSSRERSDDAPKTGSTAAHSEKTRAPSQPSADTRQLPACAGDPASGECAEERNPPPPDTDQADTRHEDDQSAGESRDCSRPGSCDGSSDD